MTNVFTHKVYSAPTTDDVLFTPDAGKAIYLTDIFLSSNGLNQLTLKFGTTIILIQYMPATADGRAFNCIGGVLKGNTDESLTVSTTESNALAITVLGFQS